MDVHLSPEDILVRSQETPNPYALKFIVNHVLKKAGKATFFAPEECRDVPLAESLLNIKGVKQVYFFENTTTITHDGTIGHEDLVDCVEAVIKTRLPVHNADFGMDDASAAEKLSGRKTHENPVANEIEEILDRTIRPGLQADGGDVEIISFENDELRILYQGACGGCPSAMMGTLDAIQGILRHELGKESLIVIPI